MFVLISLFIGGDALSGKIEEGRYCLGHHRHYTEVSYFVFTCSKLYRLSVCITHSLAILGGAIYWVTGGRRAPLPGYSGRRHCTLD
jgi:hypothetical protein